MKPITIIDGRGYVFDVEILKELREKFNIAGVLTGVLPHIPQQNVFNGLPLQLLPEEVQYLLEKGGFVLVNDEKVHESGEINHSIDMEAQTVIIPSKTRHSSLVLDLDEYQQVKFIKPKPERYHIYKYLMDRGYFIIPGLRFGCQFMAYPGDLMRYHSHYNVVGFQWNQPFDILDIVNGGRLATSVKKCWVVGAQNPNTEETEAFSIEWAGFG